MERTARRDSSGANYRANRSLRRDAPYGARQIAILNAKTNADAWQAIMAWPGYAETPLVNLPGLARRAAVAQLLYEDEAHRFTLGSLKALGGAYAVQRLLTLRLAAAGVMDATSDVLMSGQYRDQTEALTVAAVTDGNHGRSVAWGAQMFHCRCNIYLHEHMSLARENEIARYGAEIRRIKGSYDQSVHQCADGARANGWRLVTDTSANGDNSSPSLVMQGYTLLAEELRRQTQFAPPTHIFGAHLAHLPHRLSGGQQQRVAIVRALAISPTLTLFDEPTSALDPELVDDVLQPMRRLAEAGMTMIVLTHELRFARSVADRIVFVAERRIVEEGAPEAILTNPREERTRKCLRHLVQRVAEP